MTREGFAAVLRENGSGFDDAAIEEYWKCFGDEDRRRPARVLALGRLREVGALRRQARRARRAHPGPLGRDGPVRVPAHRAPAAPARSPARSWSSSRARALRLRRRAGAGGDRGGRLPDHRLSRCQNPRMERLFDIEDGPRGQTRSAGAGPAAGGADAPPLARRVRGPGAPARARFGASHGDRGGPTALDDPLRAAGQRAKTTIARMLARGAGRRSRRRPRSAPAARRCATSSSAPSTALHQRRAHDLLPRRDPSLQQGPAGHAASGRGGGPGRTDWRHH